MKTIAFSPEAVEEACAVMRNGGVIAHATETCYGLACDLSNIEGVRKLFAIKERPESQPVSGLFPSVDAAKEYVEWNARAEELSSHLPGPLTLILPLRVDAPTTLHPAITPSKTLGVRVSSHLHAQALASAFGSPISTTSANLHGKPNPYSAVDIETQFKEAGVTPDLILDSGVLPPTPPSTVVDCTTETLEKKRSGGLHI